jgi:hypothetical protein
MQSRQSQPLHRNGRSRRRIGVWLILVACVVTLMGGLSPSVAESSNASTPASDHVTASNPTLDRTITDLTEPSPANIAATAPCVKVHPTFTPTVDTPSEVLDANDDFPPPPIGNDRQMADWRNYVKIYLSGNVQTCGSTQNPNLDPHTPTGGYGQHAGWNISTPAGITKYTDVITTFTVPPIPYGGTYCEIISFWPGISNSGTTAHPLTQSGFDLKSDACAGAHCVPWWEAYTSTNDIQGDWRSTAPCASGNTVTYHVTQKSGGLAAWHYVNQSTGKQGYGNASQYAAAFPTASPDGIAEVAAEALPGTMGTYWAPDFGSVYATAPKAYTTQWNYFADLNTLGLATHANMNWSDGSGHYLFLMVHPTGFDGFNGFSEIWDGGN